VPEADPSAGPPPVRLVELAPAEARLIAALLAAAGADGERAARGERSPEVRAR
jgi:hypothetical protein